MSHRTVLLAVTLFVFAAGVIALLWQFGIGGAGIADSSAPGSVVEDATIDEPSLPPTSEALIAEALAAGDISYEESLRARAHALFDDPRLEPAFRSPIVNWEAMGALLDQITEKESTLSQDLLDDLLPFRVRPNNPRSIFNRPREEIVRDQPSNAPPPPWLGRPVLVPSPWFGSRAPSRSSRSTSRWPVGFGEPFPVLPTATRRRARSGCSNHGLQFAPGQSRQPSGHLSHRRWRRQSPHGQLR